MQVQLKVTTTPLLVSILDSYLHDVSLTTDKRFVEHVLKKGYLEYSILKYFGGTKCHIKTLIGKIPDDINSNPIQNSKYEPGVRSVSRGETLSRIRPLYVYLIAAVLYGDLKQYLHAEIVPDSTLLEYMPAKLLSTGHYLEIKTKYLSLTYDSETSEYTLTPKTPRGKKALADMEINKNV